MGSNVSSNVSVSSTAQYLAQMPNTTVPVETGSPDTLPSWSVSKASEWAGKFDHLAANDTSRPRYSQLFTDNQVDGKLLEFATHDVLQEVGVESALARARMLKELALIRSEGEKDKAIE